MDEWKLLAFEIRLARIICFHSFIAEQNHRVNGEGTSSGDQGSDHAYAEHSKNDTAEDDRVFRRGLIHDRRKDTGRQYTKDQAGDRSNGEQPESTSERCAEHLALIGSKGYADTEFTETFADGIGGHAEDAGNGKHRAQQAKHAERNGGDASGEEGRIQLAVPGSDFERQRRIQAAHRALQCCGDPLRVTFRSNNEPGLAGTVLEEGKEHGGLGGFCKGLVFTVFHHAYHFCPVAASPEFEMLTYRIIGGP